MPTPPITTVAPVVTTIPDPLPTIIKRVSVLEKDVQELKEVDHTTTHLALQRSKMPLAINAYLRSSLGDALQKVLQKQTKELKQQYSQQVNYKDVIEDSMQANFINEVKNLLPKFLPKAVSNFSTPVTQSTIKKALEKTAIVLAQTSSQDQSSLKAAESLFEYELKTILFKKMDKSHSYLTHDKHQALLMLLNSICLDDIVSCGQVDLEKIIRKRDHDGDKDEDPSTRPNQGKKTKSRRTKESELSKKTSTIKKTSKGNALTKDLKSDKSVHAEESVVEPIKEVIMDTLNDDVVYDVDQPQNDPAPKHNWFNNLQGHLLQIQNRTREKQLMIVKSTPDKLTKAHLVGLVYNLLKGTCQSSIELEYNKEECYKALSDQLDWNNPEKKYTTSITKTKAARYELVGIEDMIPSLSQINKFLKHDVYSTQKILSVVSMKVNKLHGYGYLEEIIVRRANRQLYTFKEGDFVDLHLNDIEDMLLLAAQHKKLPKDAQYHQALKRLSGIFAKELYTPSFDPPGVVYEDLNKRKRVMRADELYKFLDETLKLVRDELHHRILNFRLGYNKEMSRRKWSATDKRRLDLMVELIDKKMRER
ncbi:hypothetical protein Tco_1365160 [Tanacetum coccineum]